jgi:hypothetical protein
MKEATMNWTCGKDGRYKDTYIIYMGKLLENVKLED